MAEKKYSFETQGIFENLEKLVEEANLGKNEAKERLEAIRKLANPIYDFSPSDYRRILDKKLPLPVKKGIELYEMMKELTYLVQPIGKRKGTACAVRRIDYEKLTWEEFLELRGNFSAGFIMEAMKQRAEPNFNGLDMLNEKQKELYGRLGVYFGNKKKPTLQSLAINLLNEETNGKDFSERSLYIYLDAVKKYQKRREKAAGFDVLNFTLHSVTAFNNGKTVRESLERMDETVIQMAANLNKIAAEVGANLLKNVIPQISQSLIPQFHFPQISEMIQSLVTNQNQPKTLVKKKDTVK